MRTCSSCGNSEPDSARFCGECGAALEIIAAGDSLDVETAGVDEEQLASAVAAPTLVFENSASLATEDDPAVAPAALSPHPATWPAGPMASAPVPVTATKGRRRWLLFALVGVVVAAGSAAAALIGTGVVGGKHKPKTLADAAFWSSVNSRAMRGLATADRAAQIDLAKAPTAGGSSPLYEDGATIASYAGETATELRGLARLSAAQSNDRRLLQSFIAANRRYGEAIQEYAQQGGDFAEVQSAAATAAAADRVARSVLPSSAQLPSPAVFTISPPQAETTTTTAPATVSAVAYVNQVDALLRSSHQTVEQVKAFTPSVVSGQLGGSAAIGEADAFVAARQQALQAALQLQPPSEFARIQGLLVQSLRISLSDDQALLSWVRARNGGGDGQAELDRVNAIGSQATTAKRRFLAAYGPLRQAATGKSTSSVPDSY